MRKIWFIILLTSCMHLPALGCDECGCAASGTMNGLMDFSAGRFVGFRYGQYGFTNYSIEGTAIGSHYYSADLVASWKFGKRVQLIGLIPYKWMSYSSDGVVSEDKGVSDITVLSLITLYSNADASMQKNTSTFLIKAGIKLPTGTFNEHFRTDHLPASLSLGSGSTDLLGGLQYRYKHAAWSAFADYQAKYNTRNDVEYRFGFQQSAAVKMVREFTGKKKQLHLRPYTGVLWESSDWDMYHDLKLEGTKSMDVYLQPGMECVLGDWSVGANVDLPLLSHYTEQPDIHSGVRVSGRLYYNF